MEIHKEGTGFTQVSNTLLNDVNISLKAKGLYIYLYSKPNGWDFAAKRISQQTSEGTEAIQSGLRELERAGYIERKKRGDGKMVYFLKVHPNTQNRVLPDRENPKQGKPQTGKTPLISNKEYIAIKNISKKEVSLSLGEREKLFSLFWEEYPRKVEKKKAREKWKKLNPSKKKTEEILSGLQRWKNSDQWQRDDGRFIPHPTTFLNGERWEDEIAEEKRELINFNEK